MNKRKLQEFATWAKLNLENQIELSLKQVGINSERDVKRSRVQGDVTIIDGIEKTFNKRFNNQREQIINIVRTDGYKHTIEQFASTWFNRIIAIRFLEIHEYLDHGFKVFPNEPNTLPEILSNLNFVKEDLKLDMTYIDGLTSEGNNKEELYRYILFQQCNALAKPLPMLFSSDMDYLEYFIPTPLLFGDTIINRLLEIEEDDFKDDVEIIGWLYQFYIATKKDEVFASKEKITKDTLPAVTQLFTPEWIVKYMAENSIGRIWLESYPNSPLKDEMKYFVNEAEQEPEVEEKLKEIRYKNVNPEDIKIIEPCSGSGHILVYCFDLLHQMYLEKGYVKRDIPGLILKNNLVGLDIDKRATQLASFALVMRARSIDSRFFEEERYVRPRVYEIIDSKALLNNIFDSKNYRQIIEEYNNNYWKGENKLNSDELKTIEYVVNLFEDAKVIGSLLKVKPEKYLSLRKKLAINNKNTPIVDIFTLQFFNNEFKQLLELLRLAHFMSLKYDVMITNPPYCDSSNLEDSVRQYVESKYENSKTDLFSAFMETTYSKNNGFIAMINQQSWMYLVSFKKLRAKLRDSIHFVDLIHLGSNAFGDISGEVVQTTTFVYRNFQSNDYKYFITDLTSIKEADLKNTKFLEHDSKRFNYSNSKLSAKQDYIFSYKYSENDSDLIDGIILDHCQVFRGPSFPDNSVLRMWFEVQVNSISNKYNNQQKWVFCLRNGSKTKWFDYAIEIVKRDVLPKCSNFHSHAYYGVVWPDARFGSSTIVGKIKPEDLSYESAMNLIKCTQKEALMLVALFNTSFYEKTLKALVNGQHFSPIYVKKLPYVKPIEFVCSLVEEIIIEHENISLYDEINPNFVGFHHEKTKMSNCVKSFIESTNRSLIVIEKDERLIELTLQEELNYNDRFNKKSRYQTVSKEEYIKRLLSYLVGVLMGRYSLSEEGLIYAGGLFDPTQYGNFDVDKNGIIPIYSDINVEDGLVHRILGLIKQIYGESDYRDNIGFVAEALGKKNSETNEETLNRYLNDEFYNDHLKTYQKRPIYWMFSSGKLSGFKALIYMHRYDENTLAKLNASYFQPATTILRNQISEIEKLISISNEREQNNLNKKRLGLVEQLKEAIEYGQVLDYMANQYISIDLDDGVKVNYEKFQNIKLASDRGKLTKDLLVPIK